MEHGHRVNRCPRIRLFYTYIRVSVDINWISTLISSCIYYYIDVSKFNFHNWCYPIYNVIMYCFVFAVLKSSMCQLIVLWSYGLMSYVLFAVRTHIFPKVVQCMIVNNGL